MQFIFNFYAIYFRFLCKFFSNFYATYLQFLYNSLVKKYVLSKVNFDGTLKKANCVCSLTLSLCCAILVLLSFNSVHTDCCTSKAFSTKYQKRKRKREIQLFPMLWYLIAHSKKYANFFFFQLDKKELSFWKTKDFLISSGDLRQCSRYDDTYHDMYFGTMQIDD